MSVNLKGNLESKRVTIVSDEKYYGILVAWNFIVLKYNAMQGGFPYGHNDENV